MYMSYMCLWLATSQVVWSLWPASSGVKVRVSQELGHHWLGQ